MASELRLVVHPDELLRRSSARVENIDEEIVRLTDAMIETMHNARGIGLAGIQVGRPVRLFVTHVDGDRPRVFINPSIVGTSLEVGDHEEGCLSIPEIYAGVTRPRGVQIQAWNERGRPFTIETDGLLARVIQHEFDHLDGVLFIDRLAEAARERAMKDYSPALEASRAAR